MAYIFQKKSTGVWYLIDKKLDKPWNFLGLINRAQAKDALKNYEQKKLHLRLGIPVAPTNITIQELVEEFIDNIRGINGALTVDVEERRLAAFCKVSSESSAGSVLFDRIGQKKKRVGEIKMHELTSAKIEKFIIAKRYKPNTASRVRNFFSRWVVVRIDKRHLFLDFPRWRWFSFMTGKSTD